VLRYYYSFGHNQFSNLYTLFCCILYCAGDSIKNEMREACNTHGEDDKFTQAYILVGKREAV
jgi:hypothetical protein